MLLPVLGLRLVLLEEPWSIALAVLLFFASAYVGVAFLVFLCYAWVYGRSTRHEHPAAIVVLGSRLIDGGVPSLLRARLDRAVEVHRETEPKPLLIPSGGQGPDESRPEGEAMAEHLLAAGVPAEDVVAEPRALNTAQNLEYARRIQLEAGRDGPLLAVTNTYHVLRAEVTGAPTAGYFVPSAFLREFVAVMKGHLFLHALLFLPFLAATALVLLAALGR